MLDFSCSGLFPDGTAYKSPILDHGQFWIAPGMPDQLRDVLVSRVMPTLEEWTQRNWSEISEAPAERFTALIWRYVPQWTAGGDNPECAPGHTQWMGCAHHWGGEIHLRDETNWGGHPPPAYLRQTALHEALHILFRARHTPAGILCIEFRECSVGTVTSGGNTWRLRLRSLDEAVYTLFSHPGIVTGMSVDQVETLFRRSP